MTDKVVKIKGFPVPGSWIARNLYLPNALKDEWRYHPLSQKVFKFVSAFPEQLFTVSSIWNSYTGQSRRKETSHYKGWSLDIAPLWSESEGFKPDGTSPNLCDNLRVAYFSNEVAESIGIAAFLEDDHFHFEVSYPPGSYLYISRHRSYRNTWNEDPRSKRCYKVHQNGEIKLFSVERPDQPVFRPAALFNVLA